MGRNSSLDGFIWEWTYYLEERGHCVLPPDGPAPALQSRNGNDRCYRWLLFCSQTPTRRLTAPERRMAQRQIDQCKSTGEEGYIVVRFDLPEPKVLIMPLAKALQARRLASDKGGIPWMR